jgi:hypothetical protein
MAQPSLTVRGRASRSAHLRLSLAYGAPGSVKVDRYLRLFAAGLAHQRQRPARAGRYAQPATDAAIEVQGDMTTLGG